MEVYKIRWTTKATGETGLLPKPYSARDIAEMVAAGLDHALRGIMIHTVETFQVEDKRAEASATKIAD